MRSFFDLEEDIRNILCTRHDAPSLKLTTVQQKYQSIERKHVFQADPGLTAANSDRCCSTTPALIYRPEKLSGINDRNDGVGVSVARKLVVVGPSAAYRFCDGGRILRW